jgi:hypothetical protein
MKPMTAAIGVAIALATAIPPAAPAFAQDNSRYRVQRDRHDGPRFERQGRYAYYNHHRGYRDRRAGYRFYNGYWFPPAAFALGAIIGGAAAAAGARNVGSSHEAWCYEHYRSYDAASDTFQPYNGPRQRCISPY